MLPTAQQLSSRNPSNKARVNRRPERTWGDFGNSLFDNSANPFENFDQEAYLSGDRVQLGDDSYGKTKFNQYASDYLPINRNIPDTRNGA